MSDMVQNILGKIHKLIQTRRFSTAWQGRSGKNFLSVNGTDMEYIQDYGFFSVPDESGNALVVTPSAIDGAGVVVKAESPELRPESLKKGDVGLYNKEGVVLLIRGKDVTITGANKIEIGDSPKKLITSDFLTKYNAHTHDPTTGALITPVTAGVTTTKMEAE